MTAKYHNHYLNRLLVSDAQVDPSLVGVLVKLPENGFVKHFELQLGAFKTRTAMCNLQYTLCPICSAHNQCLSAFLTINICFIMFHAILSCFPK